MTGSLTTTADWPGPGPVFKLICFIIDEGDNSLMTFLKGSRGLPVEDITNHLTQPC